MKGVAQLSKSLKHWLRSSAKPSAPPFFLKLKKVLLYAYTPTILYNKNRRKKKTFLLNGTNYSYLWHRHNKSWSNERAVEVPIIWNEVTKARKKRILEFGNVLQHYFKINHHVIDKYEKSRGVINKDIVTFNPSKKYDLVVSISTLEHVGLDEIPKDSSKAIRAIKKLKTLIKRDGKIIITFPLGYNPSLDSYLRKKRALFGKTYFLKRVSADNSWIQTTYAKVQSVKYHSPYNQGNAIVVCIIKGS